MPQSESTARRLSTTLVPSDNESDTGMQRACWHRRFVRFQIAAIPIGYNGHEVMPIVIARELFAILIDDCHRRFGDLVCRKDFEFETRSSGRDTRNRRGLDLFLEGSS